MLNTDDPGIKRSAEAFAEVMFSASAVAFPVWYVFADSTIHAVIDINKHMEDGFTWYEASIISAGKTFSFATAFLTAEAALTAGLGGAEFLTGGLATPLAVTTWYAGTIANAKVSAEGSEAVEDLLKAAFEGEGYQNFKQEVAQWYSQGQGQTGRVVTSSGNNYVDLTLKPTTQGFDSKVNSSSYDLFSTSKAILDHFEDAFYSVTSTTKTIFTDAAETVTGILDSGDAHNITSSGRTISYGYEGNDVILRTGSLTAISGGHSIIDGGAGEDTISYEQVTNFPQGLEIVLQEGNSLGHGVSTPLCADYGVPLDLLDNIEHAVGTKFNDRIIGSSSNNKLNGGGGDDYLNGNGGTDQLYGGAGNDVFTLGNGTFAKDATPEDYMTWGDIPLTGGVSQWWNEGGYAYWTPFTSILASTPFGLNDFTSLALVRLDVTPMTTVRYALSDSDQLVIQVARGRVGQAVIDNYDLDLNTGKASGHITAFQQVLTKSSIADYTNYINLALQAAFGTCITGTDPLVIDLNKNGLELTDQSRGVYFDFDNNGFAERTAWVKATDGILVRDLNGNGKIDNQTEMFGNATTAGLTALKALDSNNDNKITSADTNFASLKVWQDLDKDGVTDSGELKTLAQVNITQLSLTSETPAVAATHGNTVTAQSTVTFGDGSTTKMGDVRLGGNLADTTYLGNNTVSPAAAALADLRGYGTITNLDVAMTNDATLLSKVSATTSLPITTTWAQYETKAADILFRWAKVDTVAPTAMGATFDRQKLAFLEKYFGYQLAPRDASGNPTLSSVDELTDSWKDVLDKAALRLAVQGPLKTLFPGITYNIDDDRFHATTATSLADAYKAVLTQLSATPATAQTQWSTIWGPLLHTLDDNMDRMDRVDVRSDYVVQSLLKASDGMTLPLSLNQLLVGMAVENVKIGTSAAETLSRGSATGTQIYYGNGGNDTLTGGTGQDVYVFGKNFGNVVINDSESVQNGDRIRFSFYNSTDVTMKSVGADLVITVKATGSTITVKNQYEMPTVALDGHALSGQKGIEEIQFADGKVYEGDDIAAVVGLGTNGNDTIAGTPMQDQIEGLKGDDLLQGGDDGDTYFFTRGDGNDTISDVMTAGPLNAPDALVLLNMTAGDLRYNRDGASNDLKITFGWSGDSITIKDQFEYSPLGYKTKFALDERMDQILFSNGTSLSFIDIQKATLQTYLTSGNDTTYGFGTDDEFLSTTGNDSLVGMDGGDVYHFGKGSGQDTIQDQSRYPETFISGLVGYSWGSDDTLVFDGDIKVSDLTFTRIGDSLDLKITIASTGDTMIVHNQFDAVKLDLFNLLGIAWFDRIEKFQFSDGTVLTWDAIVKIVTTGTAGNDALYGIILPDTLDGGAGNDTLVGADGGDTYIFGRGYGKDIIDEGQTNVIITEPDQLKFKSGIAVTDVTFTRSGLDLVVAIKGTTDSITIKNQYDVFESGPFGTQAVSRVENFVWSDGTTKIWSDIEKQILQDSQTPGNDTVTGTFFDDTINGGAGNDLLQAGDGADTYIFDTGFGQDTVSDTFANILAGNGDTIKFGAGLLPSDLRIERILPEETAKLTFVGKPDSLTIVGQFEPSPIAYHPQEIENFVFANGTTWTANDLRAKYILQNQTTGNDSIRGFDRADTIVGGLGNDSMDGDAGNDLFVINKAEGNDTVFGNIGDDTISFGAGISFDTLTYTRIPDTLDMKLGLAGGGSVLVKTMLDAYGLSLEYFKFADGTVKTTNDLIAAYITKAGTAGNDTIIGFRSDDSMLGGAGNDSIFGDIGNDTIVGGLGNDTMDAAGGNDLFVINQGEGADLLLANVGEDTVSFGAGITFNAFTYNRIPNSLDMKINLTGGGSIYVQNLLDGYSLSLETFKFADGTIKTVNDVVADYITKASTTGNDTILGFRSDDSIKGGAGNDSLFGDIGNDTIIGGTGNDSIDAAGGDDVIVINQGEGNDTIVSNVGDDTLLFGPNITFNTLTYAHTTTDNDLIINVPGGGTVLAKNILDGYGLSLEHFKFADGAMKTPQEMMAAYLAKANTTGNDTINGFNIADSILGGAGADSIIAGRGDDTIAGGAGNDSMFGDYDNDLFVINQGEGADTVDGYVGNDIISFGAGITFSSLTYNRIVGTSDIKINLTGGGSVLVKNLAIGDDRAVETFKFTDGTIKTAAEMVNASLSQQGTPGNDTIVGSVADESINGGAGNDSINGSSGNNTIVGGTGNDYMETGSGSDLFIINQADGVDTVYGFTGTDTISFGAGITFSALTYTVTNSTDMTIKLPSASSVFVKRIYDAGIETFTFADGTVKTNQQIINDYHVKAGTTGNDTIYGFGGNDSINGGAGNDSIYASNGNNTIVGGAGNDYMEAASDSDLFIINQGQGLDTVYGFTGNDTISFGSGITFSALTYLANNSSDLTLKLPSSSSVLVKRISDAGVETFNFADGTIKTNLQIIADYHTKAATAANDTIYGFATNDSINGGAGNDSIYASNGNNTIVGGAGNDYMEAASDNDLFIINQAQGVDTVYGFTGNDTISFGSGITFSGLTYSTTGDNSLTIGLPSSGSVQVKRIYDAGVETFKFSDGTIKTNVDLIKAYISKASTSANNTVYGFGTNDAINTLAGNDKIDGREGDDTITGGAGIDTITGGTGADVFDYNALTESSKTATDIITDFNTIEDMIDLRGLGFTGIAAGAASGTKLGFTYDSATNDTFIVASTNFKIILDGNKTLDASDFIFS